LTALDEREHRIFVARRLADERPTLSDVANGFAVSNERAHEIEQRAFDTVQKAVPGYLG
jgi:RNA polymerase sigma-32 factor